MKNYKFLQQFSSATTKKKLELVSRKDLKELLDGEVSVYELIYKPFGLQESDVLEDVGNNVKILTFKDAQGDYFDIPDRYVQIDSEAYNEIDYTGRAIAIDLGALPKTESIAFLLDDIKSLIEGRLGVTAIVEDMETVPSSVSRVAHDLHNADRAIKRNDDSNYYLSLQECKQEKNKLITYLNEVDACILNENCP